MGLQYRLFLEHNYFPNFVRPKTCEQQRQKTYLRTCAHCEDSDQPMHSRTLNRIFTGHILDSHGSNLMRITKTDRTALADLSLRWAHMSEGTFSHGF